MRKSGDKVSIKRFLVAVKDGIWAIFMPVIILGGIYGGFMTPTEAAAISIIYAIPVGIYIYKGM